MFPRRQLPSAIFLVLLDSVQSASTQAFFSIFLIVPLLSPPSLVLLDVDGPSK